MYSLAQLTQFVAVAEEMHFGRAAARLNMTQPPLSRQIQLLEKELGVLLFDRSSRAVKLTPAGRAFLSDARRLLAQSDRALLSVRKAARGLSGSLRIGFTGASVYSGLGAVLDSARDSLRDVDVELRELVTMAQVEALSEGALDVGMLRPPIARGDLDSRPLVREGFIAAIPASHSLASGTAELDVAELEGVDLVMYSPIESKYFFELLSGVFRDAGVTPTITQYMTQIHSIIALVNLGWGVAVVPESAGSLHQDGVVYRPLATTRQAELDLVWRHDNDNPALHRLLTAIDTT